MRQADHPDRPVTLFEIVKRAVDIVDPDADEPVTGIGNLEERVALAIEGIDNEVESPAVSVAAATIIYLAYRRDELDDDPDDVLRLAARAEWKGDPPESVRNWLADRGVDV